jgi:hypothetical protein
MTEKQTNQARELEAQGWTRQFTIEAERADEYVELYESLGDEVRVEPVTADLMAAEECATCLLAACDKYVVIYTRSGGNEHGS